MAQQDDTPEVPVVCPACETTTQVPLADLADRLDQHNEQLHDGDQIAEVDPAVAEELTDLVAEDLGFL